ncbi:MAG: DUF47 domain-containing protein [Candidatus Helarchaeota archaeon]
MTSEKELLENQLDILLESTRVLASTFNDWCSGADHKKIKEDALKVVDFEKKGDRAHEKFIEYLFTGGAVHFSKSDKLILSDKIDKILDVEELTARYLIMMPSTLKVESKCIDDLKSLSEVIINTIVILRDTVLLINKDLDEAKIKSRKVEDERRKARDLEWKILEDLLNSKPLDANLLLIKQILELFVMVADKAESLADFLDGIAIKYKTLI